jgi:Icc-related predicted phosphoesterase
VRFLFTSDLHGEIRAFQQFARALASPGHDLGVIAGDMQDDDVPRDMLSRILHLAPADHVPEMDAPYVCPRKGIVGTKYERYLEGALSLQAKELRGMLESTGKPVLMVKGNHDMVEWSDGTLLRNIGQRVTLLPPISGSTGVLLSHHGPGR